MFRVGLVSWATVSAGCCMGRVAVEYPKQPDTKSLLFWSTVKPPCMALDFALNTYFLAYDLVRISTKVWIHLDARITKAPGSRPVIYEGWVIDVRKTEGLCLNEEMKLRMARTFSFKLLW